VITPLQQLSFPWNSGSKTKAEEGNTITQGQKQK